MSKTKAGLTATILKQAEPLNNLFSQIFGFSHSMVLMGSLSLECCQSKGTSLCVQIICNKFTSVNVHTYIPLTLYPRKGSRDI
jgi:hypothetical protein